MLPTLLKYSVDSLQHTKQLLDKMSYHEKDYQLRGSHDKSLKPSVSPQIETVNY